MQDGNPNTKSKALQPFNPNTALAANQQSLHALVQVYESQACNLIVPKTMISELPPGFRFVATAVEVDPDIKKGDVYPIPGGDKLGIGKSKLNQISSALGVTWPVSRRVDDRHHPHYVEWEVVGRHTLPDGTSKEERANKTIDMRDDIGDGDLGADLKDIVDRAKRKDKPYPEQEICQVRCEIQSLAETKAKNRAIRALAGLQTSYTAEQLKARPFVAVKLALDPRDAEASRLMMANVAGGVSALYGPPRGQIIDAQLGAPTPAAAAGGLPPDDNGSQPAAEQPSQPPPLEEEHVDEKTGEVHTEPPTSDEIAKRTGAAWERIKKAKPATTTAQWTSLVKTSTGKAGYKALGWEDLDQIDRAVEAKIKEG
jgi:hypothetical protein